MNKTNSWNNRKFQAFYWKLKDDNQVFECYSCYDVVGSNIEKEFEKKGNTHNST